MIRKTYKDKEDQPNIHHAAFYGDMRELLEALEMGQSPREPDYCGTSALHKAAANGHIAALKLLLDQGCDVNDPDQTGCTPLHLAARNGHYETIRWLVEQGADPQRKSLKGRTPREGLRASGQCGYVRVTDMTAFLKQCENKIINDNK